MIHEQVKMQFEYLKSLVDNEKKNEEDCKKWGIPYEPSRTKWVNIENYEEYKREIEKNGDKNLLVMVRLSEESGFNMRGIYPFAKRYVSMQYGEYFLKHTTKHGTDLLIKESEVEIVK